MTAILTDTDILSQIDMGSAPVCQVLASTPGVPMLEWRECNCVAAWIAFIPCCAFSLLVCTGHRDSPGRWGCRKCGNNVPDSKIRWVKL